MRTGLYTRAASDAVITRIASLAPGTQANVFTATLSTNSDVRRSNHIERLGAWKAFPARVPLLDSHRRESVENVIGHCDNIRMEGGAVVADLHVSETRPNVATLMREGSLAWCPSASLRTHGAIRPKTENYPYRRGLDVA